MALSIARPLVSGSDTSSNTTSHRAPRMRSMASAPDDASPATRTSGAVASIRFTPSRTIAWSSTIRTSILRITCSPLKIAELTPTDSVRLFLFEPDDRRRARLGAPDVNDEVVQRARATHPDQCHREPRRTGRQHHSHAGNPAITGTTV